MEPNGIARSKIYHIYLQRKTAEIYIRYTGGTYIPQQKERNDTDFRMNKSPSVLMTFLIYCLSVCAVSSSAVPRPYFLPVHEVSSKQSLTAWYNAHSWAQNRTGCIRASVCEREREKIFLSWKFSHRIPMLQVNRPTAWKTLIHPNGSVLKRFPSMRHNPYQFSLSIFARNTNSRAENYPLIQVTFNVLTLHYMDLYMEGPVSFKTRQINWSETRSTSRCL